MYDIYGNIYHQYTPNVSIYIPYMDPMGNIGMRLDPSLRVARACQGSPRTLLPGAEWKARTSARWS